LTTSSIPRGAERAGEIIVDAGCKITKDQAELICTSGLKAVEVMQEQKVPLIVNSLREDADESKRRTGVAPSHEDALIRIYQRLRPGNPPALDKAQGAVRREVQGHEPLSARSRGPVPHQPQARPRRARDGDDASSRGPDRGDPATCCQLSEGEGEVEVDDIDHLGNRRLRTIDELASDELRKGFLKLRRTVQERMSLKDVAEMSPRTLINPKSISAAIEYFFGRGELSQVVDQTNPLSMLTHERRLSALGPGGLNRKRAGFEVRDVHISHYGRICPIETPEGTNIGLISSLASIRASIPTGSSSRRTARCRSRSSPTTSSGCGPTRSTRLTSLRPMPRWWTASSWATRSSPVIVGDFVLVPAEDIEYIDVAPSQMVGVSAGLIPFLEHDDANRALMGSNMQRQAVPLLVTEPPIVATGMERDVATNSGLLVRARRRARSRTSMPSRIEVTPPGAAAPDVYPLRKYVGLNERTCQNQKPIVVLGQKVEKGEVIADGAATYKGELALGRNVLVGFMAWDGFNFEDAIIISEELVEDDVYTSIHIEEYDIEIRDTKLGREEFTRDIPNVGERALHNLDESGIVRIGTYVRPGDILVGKVSPKSKTELTPEEKLLHAIFGRAGEDVKNDSLEVPSGVEGIVIATEKFSRQMSLSEEERREFPEAAQGGREPGQPANRRGLRRHGLRDREGAAEAPHGRGRQPAGPQSGPQGGGGTGRRLQARRTRRPLAAAEGRRRQDHKTMWPAVEEAIDGKERRSTA
jgi:DNA-directed RNA polymerase subunit beta